MLTQLTRLGSDPWHLRYADGSCSSLFTTVQEGLNRVTLSAATGRIALNEVREIRNQILKDVEPNDAAACCRLSETL